LQVSSDTPLKGKKEKHIWIRCVRSCVDGRSSLLMSSWALSTRGCWRRWCWKNSSPHRP